MIETLFSIVALGVVLCLISLLAMNVLLAYKFVKAMNTLNEYNAKLEDFVKKIEPKQ